MSSLALTIVGFVFTALGAGLGMAGALQMAHAYYPFTLRGFVRHIGRLAWRYVYRGRAAAMKDVETVAEVSLVNRENRSYSLIGLYFVFIGFVLQFVGAFISLIGSFAGPHSK